MEDRARTRKRVAAAVALLLLALLLAFLRPASPPVEEPPPRAAPASAPPAAVPAKPAPVPVAAAAPAASTTPTAAPAPASSAGIRLRAGTGTFGRIVDGERRPAADIPVALFMDGKVLTQTRTGADGEFALPEMTVKAADRSHFEFALLATDGKGRAARYTNRMGVTFDPDEEREITVARMSMGTLVLREATTLTVRVSAGGVVLEGATVWAEEEVPCNPGTETVATGPDGVARIDSVPAGRWTVFAKCPGSGAARTSVSVPSAGPVELALSPRGLEIEAVDASTGAAVEGARFYFWERRMRDGKEIWNDPFPPFDHPPTDSSGRTRIPDLGEVALRLRPIPPGRDEPVEGTEAVDIDALATAVRVPVRRLRTVRWKAVAGERAPPVDGSKVVVGEERLLQDLSLPWAAMEGRDARVEQGDVVVDGLGTGPVALLARAADGSLSRLEAAGDAERGPPVRFSAPRRLTVVVRDEDGKAVPDPVALLAPSGTAVAQPHMPEKEGRTVFDGLYAGEVVVCPLARTQWGGAEVARVDLAEGDRTVEAVVGRAFPLVLRFRRGGRPGLPAEFEVQFLTPGPAVRGAPHEEYTDDPVEDAEKGEARYTVRPHAPGKAVVLKVTVPGKDPVIREAAPPAEKGGETVVEIDL